MPIVPIADRAFPTPRGDELTPSATAPSVHPTGASPFLRVMRALGQEAERGEAVVSGVLHASGAGQTFGPTELLALQAGIYRYGEAVDLAAKLVDKAGTDMKTVLQGQQ